MVEYTATSPWYNTRIENDLYLDRLRIRPIPASNDDIVYTVEPQFTYRPDLLALGLYGTHKLWWVFAQRNMDIIKDPIYDLKPGLEIYLPQGPRLREVLGL